MIPAIVITGASGFIGRHLLEELKNEFRIFAIARRSQQECKAPVHPNIAWMRADIGDFENVSQAFREIESAGSADYLVHLAAFYDFSGDNRPEYKRTNVEGTKHVLELAKGLDLQRFVFISSVAACSFPKPGKTLDETSPPDGDHWYAWSKREGETLVKAAGTAVPSCIVRLAAAYSDWCEYPPLYGFLNTWLSNSPRANILGGKGESAVPYVHVRDLGSFFKSVISNHRSLAPAQVLIASPPGATTHKTLFDLATRYYYGKAKRPILVPKLISGIGLYMLSWYGSFVDKPSMERPWMRQYIDLQLTVDNSKSCSILGWSPDPRFRIERRLPFLVERLKSEPFAWHTRNLAAMKRETIRPSFLIYIALSDGEEAIIQSVLQQIMGSDPMKSYINLRTFDPSELQWFVKLIFRLILTSIHTNNRMLLLDYFEISGVNRFIAGYSGDDIKQLLRLLGRNCMQYLGKEPKLKDYGHEVYDLISFPIEFAIDEIEHQYNLYLNSQKEGILMETRPVPEEKKSARDQLEETIWKCLVHRK